jgi:hypothetical protein
MKKRIYDLVKDRLSGVSGVISNEEFLVINRRDFIFAETSLARAILDMYKAQSVSYEMYAIVDFITASLLKTTKKNVRIYLLSRSMTLPALAAYAVLGDQNEKISIYAPGGLEKIAVKDEFARQIALGFAKSVDKNLTMQDIGTNNNVDLIFCNASNEAEITSGIKFFERVSEGMILIKGYGKLGAPNCGEIMLQSKINLHCTIPGFAFSLNL